MTIKLYTYWRSSAAYRVRIALNLKGLPYDAVPVSLAPGEAEHRKDAYRALNPQMLVPYFDDGNVAIGQSMAILEYLEEAHQDVPLLPAAEPLRSQVRAFCNMVSCDIHPLNNLRVLQYLRRSLAVSDEARSHWYSHWVAAGFEAMEQIATGFAAQGPYAFGSEITLADTLLVPQVYNARRFEVPLDDYPRLVAVTDACNELAAFIDAAPENQPDYPRGAN